MDKIPVVDMAQVTGPFTSSQDGPWMETAKEIGNALHNTGFVYLKNHGIPEVTIQKAFSTGRNFFNLDTAKKSKYGKPFGRGHETLQDNNGWTVTGKQLEGDAPYEHKESFDFICGTKGLFPSEADAPGFKDPLLALENGFKDLTIKVSRLLALALGLDEHDFFLKALRHIRDPGTPGMTILRSLFYPGYGSETQRDFPPGATRCAAHTDYGFITFLFSEVGSTGLEVLNTQGKWIPAEPIPGTVLMNTADLLELWSDNYFPASLHRVIFPKDQALARKSAAEPRQSIAYFVNPDSSAEVKAIPTQYNVGTGPQRADVWKVHDRVMFRLKQSYGFA